MTNNRRFTHLLSLSLLAVPAAASADAVTPLMLAGAFHMLFGNAIIGVIEGTLLSKLFKVKWLKAAMIMVVANYFSAWTGWLLLTYVGNPLLHSRTAAPLYDAPRLLWTAGVALFLATIVLEYPFCLWALWYGEHNRRHLARKALLASVLAQVLSYGLLVPYFLGASAVTLYTELRTDRSLSFARNANAVVYFIAPGGDVCKTDADGSNHATVLKAKPEEAARSWLFARKSHTANTWDLCIAEDFSQRPKLLLAGFAKEAAEWQAANRLSDQSAGSVPNGPAFSFSQEKWEVSTGSWPDDGLTADNHFAKQSLHVGLATPFLAWSARNATILPGDLVVFSLGDEKMSQIVILDLNSRKIGLLALGRGPVVVLDDRAR